MYGFPPVADQMTGGNDHNDLNGKLHLAKNTGRVMSDFHHTERRQNCGA